MRLRGCGLVLVFLKYGRAGPANIPTAIARPASNEIVSINILVSHFAPARRLFHHHATIVTSPKQLVVLRVHARSSVRVASEEEVFQERSGKPVGIDFVRP